MHDQYAIQKLNELISQRPESCLLASDASKTLDNIIEVVRKHSEERNGEKKERLKRKILKLLALKKDEDYSGAIYEQEELQDPVLQLLRKKIWASNGFYLHMVEAACKELNQFAYRIRLLIERTQKCLKEEKYTPAIKPIISLSTGELRDENHKFVETLFVTVVIFNQHSFVRLVVSSDKVEERIQRAIRKDIIDVRVRDSEMEIYFHGLNKENIKLNCGTYKDARELQEAIHSIRNSSMFPPRQNR